MDVSAAVDRFVVDSLPHVWEHGFAQIDLDDLLGDEPSAAASVGLECLERILKILPQDSNLDGLLTIPLEPATRWGERPIPSLDDLLASAWSYGPGRAVPGLYVIHGMHSRPPEHVEEYKRPLGSERLEPRLVAYYREWREAGEAELERCIYVRSFLPDEPRSHAARAGISRPHGRC
ncbi:hypothetical protein GCM10009867_36060 [Pedococcus aerophilus]|uniref:Uncharacterized protein n=1 Tax=Pedococcus aerophilus TaxID=436356 RepID=A0ABN3UVY3_9MICO